MDGDLRAEVIEWAACVWNGAADRVVEEIRKDAPRDTGQLAASIKVERTSGAGGGLVLNMRIQQVQAEAPHGVMLNSGTGLFGPKRARIFSNSGGPLIMPPSPTGFAMSHRGTGEHKGWWENLPWRRALDDALAAATNGCR